MFKNSSRVFMLFHLSWRNLFRHRRRTLITMMSIAFGASLALIYVGIRESNYTTFVKHAARMNFGHLSILPSGFLESTTPANRLEKCSELILEVQETIPEAKVVQRVMADGVLSSGDRSEGVVILGIDQTVDTSDTLLFLEGYKHPDPVIDATDSQTDTSTNNTLLNLAGHILFENLDITLGQRLVLHTQTKMSALTSALTTISSTFKTNNDSLDSRLLVLDLPQARGVFEYSENECSFLGIFLPSPHQLEKYQTQLREKLGGSLDWGIYTWEEVNPDLVSYIKLDRVLYRVILCFVILIIGCGIFATVMMNAQERKKEVGILIAMGMTPAEVFTMTLGESTLLSTLGCLLGFIISAPLIYYLETVGIDFSNFFQGDVNAGGVVINLVLRCTVTTTIFATIFGLILLVTSVFSLYPALRLAFTQPIESIENRV